MLKKKKNIFCCLLLRECYFVTLIGFNFVAILQIVSGPPACSTQSPDFLLLPVSLWSMMSGLIH